MDKDQWHKLYVERLMEEGGLTISQAEEVLQAGMDDYDYDEDPEDCADDEMSYWNY